MPPGGNQNLTVTIVGQNQLSGPLAQAAQSVMSFASAHKGMLLAVAGTGVAIAGAVLAFRTFEATVNLVVKGLVIAGKAFLDFLKTGVSFDQRMQDSKASLAALIIATHTFTTANGQAVTSVQALGKAHEMAAEVQQRLLEKSKAYRLDYAAFSEAFNTAYVPAVRAGVKDLNQLVDIAGMAALAVKALGLPAQQMRQELRALFGGEQRISNTLVMQLGITKKEIQALQAAGKDTAEYFRSKLAPFAMAAAAATGNLSAAFNAAKTTYEQLAGAVALPIMEPLARTITAGREEMEKWMQIATALGQVVYVVFTGIIGIVTDTLNMISAGVSGGASDWRDTLVGLADVTNQAFTAIRRDWAAVVAFMMHPLDGLRLAFGYALSGLLDGIATAIGPLGFDSITAKVEKARDATAKWADSNNQYVDSYESRLKTIQKDFDETNAKIDSTATASKKFADIIAQINARAAAPAAQKGADGFAAYTRRLEEANAAATERLRIVSDLEGVESDTLSLALRAADIRAKEAAQIKELTEKYKAFNTERQRALVHDTSEKQRQELFLRAAAEGQVKALPVAVVVDDAKMIGSLKKLPPAVYDYQTAVENALAEISKKLPSHTERVAQLVTGLWESLSRSFDDVFFDVISGRLDRLLDDFKAFGEDVLRSLSQFASNAAKESVMKWLGVVKDEQGKIRIQGGVLGSEGIGGQSVGQNLQAAGLGFGVGSAVGVIGSGRYNQIGAQAGGTLGAVIGSIVPGIGTVVGALVGAVVGLIVGALASPNTEQHVQGMFANMLKAGGTATEAAGRHVVEAVSNSLASLFRAGVGAEGARSLMTDFNKVLSEAFSRATFDIAAGSPEDIQKDIQAFLQSVLPRYALQQAFGQIGFGPNGNRNAAGGIAGFDWNAGPGQMDSAGNWRTQQLYSTDSPMYRFLTGLGFTEAAFRDLAQRVASDDPSKVIEYIKGLVEVVVRFRDLGTSLGKSRAELWQTVGQNAGQTQGQILATQASGLAAEFRNLDLLTGDERIARAKELLTLAEQFDQARIQALTALYALQQQLNASIDATGAKVDELLLTPEQVRARRVEQANAAFAGAAGATRPEDLQRNTQDALSAVAEITSGLAQFVTQARSLIESLGSLQGALTQAGGAIQEEASRAADPLAAVASDVTKLQEKMVAAAGMTGQAQLDAMAEVRDAAAELLKTVQDLLREIAKNAEALHASIAAQMADIRALGETSAEKRARLQGSIASDLAAIPGATSPAALAEITARVQGSIREYLALVHQLDPAVFVDLGAAFKSMVSDVRKSIADAADPLGALARDSGKFFESLAALSGKSQEAQLEGMAALATEAQGLLQRYQAAAKAILDAKAAVDKGAAETAARIAEWGLSASERRSQMQAEIDAAMASISTAASPEEISRATGKIQDLVLSYQQMLTAVDPAAFAALGDAFRSMLGDARQSLVDAANPLASLARGTDTFFQHLSALSGKSQEDQLEGMAALATEAQGLLQKYQEAATAILNAEAELSRGSAATVAQIGEWGLSNSGKLAQTRGEIDRLMASLSSAASPEELTQTTGRIQELILSYQQMLTAVDPAAFGKLADSFRTMAADVSQALQDAADPLAAMRNEVSGIFASIEALQTQSAEDQLTSLAAIGERANSVYAAQRKMLEEIGASITRLHESIASQRFDLSLSTMTPQQQAQALTDEINRAFQAIGTAASPQELQRLTGRIQELGGRYYGLFGQDDPRRAEAAKTLDDMLAQTEQQATARYEALGKQITDANQALADAMEQAGVTAQTGMETVRDKFLAIVEDMRIRASSRFRGMLDTIEEGAAALGSAVGGIDPEPIMTAIRDKFLGIIESMRTAAETRFGQMLTTVENGATALGTAVGAIDPKPAWDAIKEKFLGILGQMETAASARYEEMRLALVGSATTAGTALGSSVAALTASVTEATGEIDAWAKWLKGLRGAVDLGVTGMADEIVSAGSVLAGVLTETTSLFTDLNGAMTGGSTTGGSGAHGGGGTGGGGDTSSGTGGGGDDQISTAGIRQLDADAQLAASALRTLVAALSGGASGRSGAIAETVRYLQGNPWATESQLGG